MLVVYVAVVPDPGFQADWSDVVEVLPWQPLGTRGHHGLRSASVGGISFHGDTKAKPLTVRS